MADDETKRLFEAIDVFNKAEKLEAGKEWRRLKKRIFTAKTYDEIVKMAEDVKAFLLSDAPEEDKEKLKNYVECIPMMLSLAKSKR